MVTDKGQLEGWVVEALNHFQGQAHLMDVAKWIWSHKRNELYDMGDMFYKWQYVYRWCATDLRNKGILLDTSESPQGTWVLSGSD